MDSKLTCLQGSDSERFGADFLWDVKSSVKIETNDVVRKRLAKVMARDCFGNTRLEDYHAGTFPSSKTGDYLDVKVVSPFGEIAWNKLSRLSDEEMKTLMTDLVNHCYKFLLELFVTDSGEGLITMLEQRDLLATWYDAGANGSSTVGDGQGRQSWNYDLPTE